MTLWKLLPAAPEGSSYWLDHRVWKEVVVRATSAAEARLVAAEMERRQADDHVPVGNESHSFRSGFEDEKLYWVKRLNPDDEPDPNPDGPEEILRAES